MEEITIQLSKKKITLLFLGAIGFVAVGVWLFQIADTVSRYNPIFRHNPIFVKLISIVDLIFFGLCGVYAFKKFFDNKPGLVINDEGIIDNSSGVSAGLTRWENITNVSITEIFGQKILTIEINNADEILSKQSGIKRFLMNLNDSPVQISSNTLKCNFQELYDSIKKRLAARHIA